MTLVPRWPTSCEISSARDSSCSTNCTGGRRRSSRRHAPPRASGLSAGRRRCGPVALRGSLLRRRGDGIRAVPCTRTRGGTTRGATCAPYSRQPGRHNVRIGLPPLDRLASTQRSRALRVLRICFAHLDIRAADQEIGWSSGRPAASPSSAARSTNAARAARWRPSRPPSSASRPPAP